MYYYGGPALGLDTPQQPHKQYTNIDIYIVPDQRAAQQTLSALQLVAADWISYRLFSVPVVPSLKPRIVA